MRKLEWSEGGKAKGEREFKKSTQHHPIAPPPVERKPSGPEWSNQPFLTPSTMCSGSHSKASGTQQNELVYIAMKIITNHLLPEEANSTSDGKWG